MRQATGTLTIETRRQGLVEITGDVTACADGQEMDEGLFTLFCRLPHRRSIALHLIGE